MTPPYDVPTGRLAGVSALRLSRRSACPTTKLPAKALVDFFNLGKAVCEVNDKRAKRPGRVSIPRDGIRRGLAKLSGLASAAPP